MPSSKSAVHLLADKSLHILVTGATGQQGGSVLRHLKARGHRLRALVRDRNRPAARALQRLGVEVFQGGFEDARAIEEAAQLVDAAFLMSTSFEKGADGERRQGIAAIDALRAADVPYIVYSSVASATQHTGIPHFDSKFAVENHLRSSGTPFAIVGPVAFMENLTSPFALPGLRQGQLLQGLRPEKSSQLVALEDLGAFDTLVLENPARFRGQRIEIASDEVTGLQTAEILSRHAGRPIQYRSLPLEAIRQRSEDLARMMDWLDRAGYTVDIERLRRDYPDVGWQRLEEWASEQDWPRLLAPA
ncbi:MAG TPA: NmrA/HSCARG family protein [Thermoplasmata archaeon]|nr:NmrA/HSCARG family protein [Thermoplasmata archaeon]